MMKRDAVSFWGLENMKALNDMDLDSLRGAFGGTPVIINDQQPLAKAIENQTRVNIDISEKGITSTVRKGNAKVIRQQARHRF